MESYKLAVYFLTYLFEFLVIYVYCRNMFLPRFNRRVEMSVGIVLYVGIGVVIHKGSYLLLSKNTMWINTMYALTFNCCYIACLFQTKLRSALLHSAVSISAMAISEVITYSITRSVTFFFDENAVLKDLLINILASKLLYALAMYALFLISRKFLNANAGKRFDKVLLLIITISLLSTFETSILLAVITYTYSNLHYDIITFFTTALMIIPNLALFVIYGFTQTKNEEFSKLQVQLQKERDSMEYYKMLLSQIESQGILIHDIKKHLQSISLLNEQNERDKIAEYINSIINSSDLQESAQICDNRLLNTILNRYISKCRKKNIDFYTVIRKNAVNFMKDDDLTALFCNILDNAYNSASRQEESFIELKAGRAENTDYTVIALKNSCSTNPFLSQHIKAGHGYGLKSVKRIAESYGGHMQTYFEEGEGAFHTIVMLKDATH